MIAFAVWDKMLCSIKIMIFDGFYKLWYTLSPKPGSNSITDILEVIIWH